MLIAKRFRNSFCTFSLLLLSPAGKPFDFYMWHIYFLSQFLPYQNRLTAFIR